MLCSPMAHADVTSSPLPSFIPRSFWVDIGLYTGDPDIKRCDSDTCPPLQQGWLLAKELTRKSCWLGHLKVGVAELS